MDSNIVNDLIWTPCEMTYRCSFGEVNIFSLTINGVKTSPNIFEIPSQNPSPAPGRNHQVSHAYSLPCTDTMTRGVSIKAGYIHHILNVYRHYYVDTSGDFDAYLSRFKGKTLNSLKRKISKVDNSNTLGPSVYTYQTLDDVMPFIDTAKIISKKSYQEKLLGRELPTNQTFIDKLKSLAINGNFRGYVLYAEDKPIAYNLCPVYGKGILLYDFTGYDPEYHKYSPGTVLQYNIIRQCFSDETIHIYDLCTGEGKHKEFFATNHKICCDVFYFPITLFYIATVYLRYLIELSGRSTIRLLDILGIKSRIKTFIRRI